MLDLQANVSVLIGSKVTMILKEKNSAIIVVAGHERKFDSMFVEAVKQRLSVSSIRIEFTR